MVCKVDQLCKIYNYILVQVDFVDICLCSGMSTCLGDVSDFEISDSFSSTKTSSHPSLVLKVACIEGKERSRLVSN